MMYYSDNRALWLLQANMVPREYDAVLDNMDVANEQDGTGQDAITVHSYSGFLRILYNASFLNQEMSEKALLLMSYEDFPQGIAAGIPKGVKLASKFGEFSDSKRPDIVQIHEFAIVYHPKGPYILGILTRGKNVDKQLDLIRTVSKMTYDSVGSEVPNGGR
jgi:beta-lactamase class A